MPELSDEGDVQVKIRRACPVWVEQRAANPKVGSTEHRSNCWMACDDTWLYEWVSIKALGSYENP